MRIKHKLLSDYQYTTPDKKIFLIKSGTILEEYVYKVKNESITIDRDIIDNNPDFFEVVDWKYELMTYMKAQKLPTPAQLHKKIVPFIEEMVLSSIQQNSTPVSSMDEAKVKELEWKEIDLNNREKRVKDKEEEIDIRLQRVEKREGDYKQDLKDLDKREDDLRVRSRELTEKLLNIEDEMQKLNEKERNIDRSILESATQIDEKYKELQSKIDEDLKNLSEKEKDLDKLSKDLKRREDELNKKESELEDRIRDFEMKNEDFIQWSEEVIKLNNEIKDWENLHWKFRRTKKPPSAE